MNRVLASRLVRLDVDVKTRSVSAFHLGTRCFAELNQSEALLLVGALRPTDSLSLVERVSDTTATASELVLQMLLNLLDVGFINLTDTDDDNAMPSSSYNKTNWKELGWSCDFDYLHSSLDMTFFASDEQGYASASKTMLHYSSKEPDETRFKTFEVHRAKLPLPQVADLINDKVPVSAWSLDHRVRALASCIVAPTKTTRPQWGGAPLLRKLHPSGGARHPTEAYLLLQNTIGNLQAGYYHIHVSPLELVSLSIPQGSISFNSIEPLVNRVPFSIVAGVCLTSCFARNRYRYRESRTYRTVHMDIGHVLANIEYIAQFLLLKIFVAHTWDSQASQTLTGANYLEEGMMATIFIGDNA